MGPKSKPKSKSKTKSRALVSKPSKSKSTGDVPSISSKVVFAPETTSNEDLLPDDDDDDYGKPKPKPLIQLPLAVDIKEEEEDDKPKPPPPNSRNIWKSTVAYVLTLTGYAVGLGNFWRFPYQLRDNGGIAFVIPYCIMFWVVGLPIFFLELAVGQRARKGLVYAWNDISPGLGGLGICFGCICFMIGSYYITLLAYCISYLVDSCWNPLPWTNCKAVGKRLDEQAQYDCEESFSLQTTKYYWYRGTLGATESINDYGEYSGLLFVYHVVAWCIILFILYKGTGLTEKIIYFTASLPYVVLLIFFIANLCLEPKNAWLGAYRLLKPEWEKLLQPITWLRAGSQIFFSLGLGTGIITVYASYGSAKNDCFKHALYVCLVNSGTSLFAALVVFPIIGTLGYHNYEVCVKDISNTFPGIVPAASHHYDIYFVKGKLKDWDNISETQFLSMRYAYGELFDKDIENLKKKREKEKIIKIDSLSMVRNEGKGIDFQKSVKHCSIGREATASGPATGFVFVGFTQAVLSIPGSNFWSIIFFVMLFFLGLDSGFATVEGTVNMLEDLTYLNRTASAVGACFFMMTISLVLFPFGNGIYILNLLDQYAANWTLLITGLIEVIAVAWVYGLAKISYDVKLMTGRQPGPYILLCWKYLSPFILLAIIVGTLAQHIMEAINRKAITHVIFHVDNNSTEIEERETIPLHSMIAIFLLIIFCLMWLPIQALLRNTKYTLLRKKQDPTDFPEEELIQIRQINFEEEHESFNEAEKKIIGRKSVYDLQEYLSKKSEEMNARGSASSPRMSTVGSEVMNA